MTDEEKMIMLKDMLDPCEDSDEVLLSFLEISKGIILNKKYPYLDSEQYAETDLPALYDSKQLRIAVYLLNKRGAEGETIHSENGIRRDYGSSDIPPEMLRDIMPSIAIPR